MSHSDPEPYDLTVGEAAAVLGVHGDTLRRWTDDGKVPAWISPTGHRRYRRSDLTAMVAPGGAA